MAIISAAVEGNGWVLSLVVAGSAGGFADYVLDADVTPRVLLRSMHPGFVQSAGQAAAGNMAREIAATVPLRLPVNPASPTTAVIDEEDLGGGQRRVRLALANHVYATDTGLTLEVLAGWRTGESAATGLSVSNNSTLAAPMPIMRWARLQFQIETGVFRLALMVASHHPLGVRPVAGVKFTVSDGVTVKTVWATELGTDTRHGDNLRCYTVEVDPTTGPALAAGMLRCDAEIYPWLGVIRSTDPAGTRLMDDLKLLGRESGAVKPMIIGYDPAGVRYSSQWVYVDALNGTNTAAAGMVQTGLAAAKAVPPASRPRDMSTALQALYLANRTLTAANGAPGYSRSCDGARIVLAPGVSVVGNTSVTTGLQTGEIPAVVMGDPDDPDPRANCILRSGTAQPAAMRIFRLQMQDMTAEIGQATLTNGVGLLLLDNVTVRGKAGFEASTSGLTSNTLTAGTYSISAVNTLWWRCGIGMNTTQLRFLLVRNCQFSRPARAAVLLTSRWIQPDDPTVGAGSVAGTYDVAADVAGCEDNFIAYNDFRRARTRALLFTLPAGASAGTAYASQRRQVVLGNVIEVFQRTATQPMMSIGEGQAVTAAYNIIENNSFIGERVNIWYNDPPTASTAVNSELFCNRQANNAFDRNATKHDDFLDSSFGYRPHLTGGWSAQCGVMHEGNWDGGRAAGNINTFRYYFRGLRSLQTAVETAPAVVDDRSRFGTDAGGGDYRPVAGSPLLGRLANSNTDRDLNGVVRAPGSPAGAYEAEASDFMLAPLPGAHAMLGGLSGLVTSLGLVPANARHGHLADMSGLLADIAIAAAGSALPVRVSTSALLLSVAILPARGTHLLPGNAPELFAGGLVLQPGAAGHQLLDAGTLLNVPSVMSGARRLAVGPDPRTGFARVG